jgi:hypothetical protein
MLNCKALVCSILLALLLTSCFFDFETTVSASTCENTWETKAPIPISEGVKEATAVNGKIYVMGGSINYEYDPATNNWTLKASMPTPRWRFGITVYENKIYTFGGWHASETEVYNPATNTWQTKTSLPSIVDYPHANVIDNKIYVLSMNGSYCYDIAKDSWSVKSNAPHGGPQTAIDGKIYAFYGDYTGIYDPKSDSWSEGASMPIPLYVPSVCATTGIMSPKRIYLFGGIHQTFDDGTNITQVYDPTTNNWTLGKPMSMARSEAAIAVLNDQIYLIGGNIDFYSVTDVNEQYTPFGYGTPDVTYQTKEPEPTLSPTGTSGSGELSVPIEIAIIFAVSVIIIVSIFVYYKRQKHS